jgi:enoyl-CoA hydratase/carnithine racemase
VASGSLPSEVTVPDPRQSFSSSAVPPIGGGPEPDHGAVPGALRALLEAAHVRLEYYGRRADVVLDAPQRRNAQTPATWRGLAAAARWLAGRADVVVLRASGPSFSAGLDRRAFTPEGIPGEFSVGELARLDDAALDARIALFQEGFTGWADGPFLSVAAVHGHAVGAGFQLALACDLRLAADDARFSMREPALGLVPDLAGTHPLVAAVGAARALEICATGRSVDAVEAESLGLVQAVVPASGLEAATDDLVGAVLANPARSVLATRALLRGADRRTPQEQRAAERAAQIPLVRAMARGTR